MEALRTSRPRFNGAVTKVAGRLARIKADDAASIARIDPNVIQVQLDSLEKTERNFKENLEAAKEHAPEDDDEYDTFEEAESVASDSFQEAVFKTRETAKHLLALRQIQRGLSDLTFDIEELEKSLATRPDCDHSSSCLSIDSVFNDLRQTWRKENLPQIHPLKSELDACIRRIHTLTADCAGAKCRATPAFPTHPVAVKTERNLTKLPAISLPTFSGDVLTWPTFWNQFVASVDSNSDLPDSTKLSYLRRAIKDPEAEVILNPSIDGPDTYGRLIKELQLRYRRTKKIHRNLVEKLVQLPSAKYNSSDLRKLVDAATNSLECLQTTGHYTLETFITSLIYAKLPYKLQVDWDKDQPDTNKVMPYSKLFEYVSKTAFTLSDHKTTTTTPVEKTAPAKKKEPTARGRNTVHTTSATPSADSEPAPGRPDWRSDCELCRPEKHPLWRCPKWEGWALPQKLAHIAAYHLCSNCLHKGHITESCKSKYRCNTCRQKHHSSIHQQSTTIVNHASFRHRQVPDALMTTAKLLLIGPTGIEVEARALIDSGSGISLVTQQVSYRLQLKLEPAELHLTVVQGETSTPLKHLTNLLIAPLSDRAASIPCVPAVADIVTAKLPSQPAPSVTDLPHMLGLYLADDTYNLPGHIDILLGAEMASGIFTQKLPRQGKRTEPMAHATIFGWTIIGPVPGFNTEPSRSMHHLRPRIVPESVEPQLETVLAALLQEEEGAQDATPTQLDQQVEKHYTNNVTYSSTDQRYTVCLPKKNCISNLGKSRPQAVHRFLSTEKSNKKKQIEPEFQNVLKTYLELGHAEPVPPEDHPPAAFFWLPMHAVFKEASTSTKLRVVFDGSATTTSGLSLNQALYVGPTIQATLSDTIIRFRKHPVALNADISKMYREVQLSSPDRDLHRFIWRESPESELRDYRMTRVTFGVSASPFLAVRTLHQTAVDHGEGYPEATQHIQGSFYVDDYLGGAATPEDAIRLFTEIRDILQKGGFQLRKWRSSSTEVLDQIPKDLQESDPVKQSTAINPATQSKALGLLWDSSLDVMSPAIYSDSASSPTKRGLTSAIFKSYDVLGWISPTVLQMKMLIQGLWTNGTGWDDAASQADWQTYQAWKDELPILTAKRIDRCYTKPGCTTVSLHGFADASMKAYGAVVYCRATYPDREPTISLVASKTKLVKKPKKKKDKEKSEGKKELEDTPPETSNSIHRLELCAALLLAKLISKLGKLLDIPPANWVAWSDSSTVLAWLDGNSRSQPIYETNRVRQTLELTAPSIWHYVPTLTNPADCASRGLSPAALFNHQLWWDGPPWLKEDPYSLPNQPPRKPLPDAGLSINVALPYFSVAEDISGRPHQYPHLVAIAAWCLRFVERLKEGRPSPDNRTKRLTGTERRQAEQWLLREAQKRSFMKGINLLKKKKLVGRDSRLRMLNPHLDENDLLRVGGRLTNSARPTTISQPIITDSKDVLMENYYHYLHQLLCHCGPTLLLAYSGSKLHIIGARRLSRRVCSKCVTCRRTKPKTQKQFMAELPAPRVNASPPFTNCGMDFAGPFTIKLGRVRQPVLIDAWICVFVCLATKAVHLEVVSEESTTAFEAALQRFIARRGCPQHLYSDNGGNFVGARNRLTKLYQILNSQKTDEDIQHFLSTHHQIQWHNIPAYSPHMGGLWEAAVKAMKKHLLRVMGVRRYTFEELTTIACRIEACLNNRPLLPLTSHNIDGVTALTPGHFLLNKSPSIYPEDPTPLQRIDLQQKWNLCQAVTQQWWTRWHKEYLNSLQARTKWQTTSTNLKEGDVVAIRPRGKFIPSHWPIGRIVSTMPGKDGRVRVVNVKNKSGTLQRSVTQVALIYRPGEEDDQDPEQDQQQPQPGPQSLFRQEEEEA